MPIRAVTLDLWLTLVWDTEEMDDYWRLRRLINLHRFLKEKRGVLKVSEVRMAMEGLSRRLRQANETGLEYSTEERGRILFEILGIEFAQHEEQKMRERAGRILSNSGSSSRLPNLNPEASPVLHRLKKDFPGIKIGLLSNAGRSSNAYAQVLESLGIMRYFDSLTISCEVGFIKPRGEIFERAASSLSTEPSEVLHIGDSFESDIVGATSFGMNAALYTGLFSKLNASPSWSRYVRSFGPRIDRIPRGFKTKRGLLLETIRSLHEIPKLIQRSGDSN